MTNSISSNSTPNTAVYLLGAGFSACITGGQLPLMAGFFDNLSPEEFPTLYDFVHAYGGDVAMANVEKVIGWLDQLSEAPLTDAGDADKWRRDEPEIRLQLGHYTLKRLYPANFQPDHWGVCVLASADEQTTVITTNYDNLAERILSNKISATHGGSNPNCHHCRMRRILLHDCECNESSPGAQPDWRGSVLKLHGSIAWKTCSNRLCRQFRCLVAECDCRPTDDFQCPCCGKKCESVLVLPSQHKHYKQYPHLSRIWDSAQKALLDAKWWLVFGFSLPDSDHWVQWLIRKALASGRVERISIIDINPESVARRFKQLQATGSAVNVETFTVPSGDSHPTWLG